jgi:DNA methylase
MGKRRKKKKPERGFFVRFSPYAAAIDAMAEELLHYKLTPSDKKEMLGELHDYPHAGMIQHGTVKQQTRFNPLSITYFPHFWNVPAGGMRTPQELFGNHSLLAKALEKWNERLRKRTKHEREEEKDAPGWIRWYLTEAGITAASIRKAVRMYTGTQAVSAFSPAQAAAIYHRLLPENGGVTWDMSCGWGGRLLGALTCDRVCRYIGCDPSTETYKGLVTMRDELLPMAVAVRREIDVKLHDVGSETEKMRDVLPKGGVSLCFSSPPYFSTERYSDEATQSWRKFPDPESWLNGFMGATLDNCEYCLKPGGTLAINIADVKEYEKLSGRKLTDDFVALAKRKGWRLVRTLQLELSAAPGSKHKHGKHKHEPIYVFKRKA